MKVIYPFLFLCAILSGCATASISTIKLEKPKQHYIGLMTLVVNMDADFNELDSATYEKYIRRKFNNLENAKSRDHLENALAEKLQEQAQTRVVKSSEVFGLNKDVTFDQFIEGVKASGVDGILFVNERKYWLSNNMTTIHDGNISTTSVEPQPNAKFHTYLIDSGTWGPVWYANSTVNGSYVAGYDTLNNHLVRALYRKLKKDKYIITKTYRPQ